MKATEQQNYTYQSTSMLILFTADVATSAYINTTKDNVVYATTVESITVKYVSISSIVLYLYAFKQITTFRCCSSPGSFTYVI